jgi:hypothetical protein
MPEGFGERLARSGKGVVRLTALTGLATALACGPAIDAPTRNPLCFYAGDTVGVVQIRSRGESAIRECVWLIADHETCFQSPVSHQHSGCVVGEDTPLAPTRP